MSDLTVVLGSASNSAQLHLPSREPPSWRAKVQSSSLICGVGPAERTGKSAVTYCPGGMRFFRACSCRLDAKPREIGALFMEVVPLLWRLREKRSVTVAPQSPSFGTAQTSPIE